MPVQTSSFPINETVKARLVAKLRDKGDIITFADEPVLAALCTCLALQFEMGKPAFDRLSAFLDVDIHAASENPWHSEIIVKDHDIGIQFWLKNGKDLSPRHPDLQFILDQDSFVDDRFQQFVIYPRHVAATYAKQGLQLVIVRDWLLQTSLCLDERQSVSYLYANEWEIQTNIAAMQVKLMCRQQLAFFGTHDIVDHLFNADVHRYAQTQPLAEEVLHTFAKTFAKDASASRTLLYLSYAIGIVLDDLAQSKWYGSEKHRSLASWCLQSMRDLTVAESIPITTPLPHSFHELMATLRDETLHLQILWLHFQTFLRDITTYREVCGETFPVSGQGAVSDFSTSGQSCFPVAGQSPVN